MATEDALDTLQEIADTEHNNAYDRAFAADTLVMHRDAVLDRRPSALTHLGWWALIVGLALAHMCCAPVQSYVRGIQQQGEATVSITGLCPGGQVGYGSGVMASEFTILTAHHVAKKAAEGCMLLATTDEGKTYPLVLGRQWPDRDIGELRTGARLPYVRVDTAPLPPPGSRVCINTGFPIRLRKCGDVQMYRVKLDQPLVDILVEPGNSGSPVYDERGRLIGIAHSAVFCPATGQLCEGIFSSVTGIQ